MECRPCHQQIYDSYQKTAMGRSFTRAVRLPPLDEFSHAPSQRFFAIVTRGGAPFLRRYQSGNSNILEKRIDYLIGSGTHSFTPVHRSEAGEMIELPVSWYSDRGGYWAMTPGYDRADHSDVRRAVADGCLFCHNGYPSAANSGVANGIDCQRCHGPGEEHARRRGKITNPARLSPDRQAEVCMQCHLETAGRNIPSAIRRFERKTYSYRPGQPLSDYMLYFRFDDAVTDDSITVNSSAHRLRQSPCFVKSGGRLQCTTCHDPHGVAAISVVNACRSCHTSKHSRRASKCADCHMPKQRTQDAVHVVMTDHLIRRAPPANDRLRPRAEQHGRQSGRVSLSYPERPTPDEGLYVAVAQARATSNPRQDAAALARAIASAPPKSAEPYIALAETYALAGDSAGALKAWRAAFTLQPDGVTVATRLAEALAAAGQRQEAVLLLERRLQDRATDSSLLNALAVLYADEGRFQESIRLLGKALQNTPEDPVSWLNMGVCLEATGDKKGAEAAYRQAVLLQPDLSRAQVLLKRLSEH